MDQIEDLRLYTFLNETESRAKLSNKYKPEFIELLLSKKDFVKNMIFH